jgi:hypothetical protein
MRRAAILALALGAAGCASRPPARGPASADQAYLQGAADAAKQLYWAKQALEAPRGVVPAGRTEYYTWEESGAARDGRRLAPETVAVPVFIPEPAPAAQDR